MRVKLMKDKRNAKKINKNRKLEEKRKKKKKESRIKIGQKLGKNENRFYN